MHKKYIISIGSNGAQTHVMCFEHDWTLTAPIHQHKYTNKITVDSMYVSDQ